MTLTQLKVLQEVITLLVFAPFAVLYVGQPPKLDYLWAGLCLTGRCVFYFPQLTYERQKSYAATDNLNRSTVGNFSQLVMPSPWG